MERSNIALDVILKHQRADFEKYSGKLVNNIKKLVIPYLEMMNQTGLQERPGPERRHGSGQSEQHHLARGE